jgi:hypothetical protein
VRLFPVSPCTAVAEIAKAMLTNNPSLHPDILNREK